MFLRRFRVTLVILAALTLFSNFQSAASVSDLDLSSPAGAGTILAVAPSSSSGPAASTSEASLRGALGVRATAARKPTRYLLVDIESGMPIFSRPGGQRRIGVMPASSKYYGIPTVAWVLEQSRDGRHGRVTLPYTGSKRTGWISMKGLDRSRTTVMVRIDVSEHRLTLLKGGKVLMRTAAATGAPWSPTPTGKFFVTDRVPFSPGSYLGAFAFGISGIQPRLPPGWSGGNQLAIHGTNDPGSIGRSASAGCLRVSAKALMKLKPFLQLGIPVVIAP